MITLSEEQKIDCKKEAARSESLGKTQNPVHDDRTALSTCDREKLSNPAEMSIRFSIFFDFFQTSSDVPVFSSCCKRTRNSAITPSVLPFSLGSSTIIASRAPATPYLGSIWPQDRQRSRCHHHTSHAAITLRSLSAPLASMDSIPPRQHEMPHHQHHGPWPKKALSSGRELINIVTHHGLHPITAPRHARPIGEKRF